MAAIGKLVSDPNARPSSPPVKDRPKTRKWSHSLSLFLSRKPTAEELPVATEALSSGLGISDLAWSLANTREFLFVQ